MRTNDMLLDSTERAYCSEILLVERGSLHSRLDIVPDLCLAR